VDTVVSFSFLPSISLICRLPAIMAPRQSHAVNLAMRIEATAVTSHAIACLSCQRRHLRCIRSPISSRCSGCVRSNHRCITDSSSLSRDPFLSAVRADIRRLRTSLLAFDRSLQSITSGVSLSVVRESPNSPGPGTGVNPLTHVGSEPSDGQVEILSRHQSPVESILNPSDITPVVVSSSNSTSIPLESLLNPVHSVLPSRFSLSPVSASSETIALSSGLMDEPPFAFVDPSLLLLDEFVFPEPPAGVLDFGSLFNVSDS